MLGILGSRPESPITSVIPQLASCLGYWDHSLSGGRVWSILRKSLTSRYHNAPSSRTNGLGQPFIRWRDCGLWSLRTHHFLYSISPLCRSLCSLMDLGSPSQDFMFLMVNPAQSYINLGYSPKEWFCGTWQMLTLQILLGRFLTSFHSLPLHSGHREEGALSLGDPGWWW